jgi:hypothetical protein
MSDTGTIRQRPLYGCAGCYDEYSWPAEDLRVDGEMVWCENCWSDGCFITGDARDRDWNDLDVFSPELQQ